MLYSPIKTVRKQSNARGNKIRIWGRVWGTWDSLLSSTALSVDYWHTIPTFASISRHAYQFCFPCPVWRAFVLLGVFTATNAYNTACVNIPPGKQNWQALQIMYPCLFQHVAARKAM